MAEAFHVSLCVILEAVIRSDPCGALISHAENAEINVSASLPCTGLKEVMEEGKQTDQ